MAVEIITVHGEAAIAAEQAVEAAAGASQQLPGLFFACLDPAAQHGHHWAWGLV